MIKAIIFDCFGVLTADLWREFVAALPEELRGQASQYNHAVDAGLISLEEYEDKVCQLTGASHQQLADIRPNAQHKNSQLLNYIGSLRERGYKIGLLSNVSSNWVREEFLTESEIKLFDHFTLSYQIQTIKPDPAIYQEAAQGLGAHLNECLYVDDLDRYTEAAEGLGMAAVTYKNFKQMKTDIEAKLADVKA